MHRWTLAGAALVLLGAAALAHSQKATEIFTPIGKSPGLSGKVTVIGTIRAVDETAGTITVAGDGEEWTAEIVDTTQIWLDKTPIRETNTVGESGDLRLGARVEVHYEDPSSRGRGPAEWIKVEVTESTPQD